MSKRESWDFWVLGALRDGKPAYLKDIYAFIDNLPREGYINPQSYNVNSLWGDRPKYTHVVRSTMSSLKKRGMAERLGKGKRTGIYRITNAGTKYLEGIEP